MLRDLSLADFIEAVSAKTATPGGGSVSAAGAAMGAALGIMAARFTDHPQAAAIADSLEELKRQLVPLIDRDSEAYSQVSKAYSLPKKTDEEKARRKEAIQAALKEAADVPLAAMTAAGKALEALVPLQPIVNKNLYSDYAGAVLFLTAGLAGCALNVRINAGLMSDPARRSRLEQEADRIEQRSAELRRALAGPTAPKA